MPEPERSHGGGHGYPLQYSCLESSMDRGAWQATVHGVAKNETKQKRLSTHTFYATTAPFIRVYVEQQAELLPLPCTPVLGWSGNSKFPIDLDVFIMSHVYCYISHQIQVSISFYAP